MQETALPGGGHCPYMCICRYVLLERPHIFIPKFPLQSISFSQIAKKNPLRSMAISTVFAAPETIISKISLHSSRSVAAHSRGLLQLQPFAAAPRCDSRPECQPDASYKSAPETPISRSSPLQSPAFSRSSRSGAPVFHFAVAHTDQNVGRVPPPPPETAIRLSLA